MSAEVMETADALPAQLSPKNNMTAGASQWRTEPPRIRQVILTRQAFERAKCALSNRQQTLILGCGETGVKCTPQGPAAKIASSESGTAVLFLDSAQE